MNDRTLAVTDVPVVLPGEKLVDIYYVKAGATRTPYAYSDSQGGIVLTFPTPTQTVAGTHDGLSSTRDRVHISRTLAGPPTYPPRWCYGEVDWSAFESSTGYSGTISRIGVVCKIRRDSAWYDHYYYFRREGTLRGIDDVLGGTPYQSSSGLANQSIEYVFTSREYSTGVAWTPAKLASISFGHRLQATTYEALESDMEVEEFYIKVYGYPTDNDSTLVIDGVVSNVSLGTPVNLVVTDGADNTLITVPL